MNKQAEQIAGKLAQRSVDLVSFEELKAKLDEISKILAA